MHRFEAVFVFGAWLLLAAGITALAVRLAGRWIARRTVLGATVLCGLAAPGLLAAYGLAMPWLPGPKSDILGVVVVGTLVLAAVSLPFTLAFSAAFLARPVEDMRRCGCGGVVDRPVPGVEPPSPPL